ncbi:MurR/RpiR family transcriptional regulator [Flavonifractor plautii]|uniref:MurR/RpiR family transcriptional regulator n=1 Tax=Flavonifractor plautii TaxID=292800 RepID=UPI003EEA36A0
MPFGNVFEKINSEYYQLTSAEKKVADYAVIHQQKTQFMSISELAEEAGVAEATISRFCKRLGYKGYSAFKLAVANSTARRVEAPTVPGRSGRKTALRSCVRSSTPLTGMPWPRRWN